MGVKLGLTLTGKRRYRALENRVLRIIFGSKRQAVIGELRILHYIICNFVI
jgi:hypothetical protein